MKIAGIFSEIMNYLPSGHNEAMAIEEALKRYMLETKKAFKYIEGYNLLKGCPKFMAIPKLNPSIFPAESAVDDGDIFQTPERPLGKASTKKRQREEQCQSEEKAQQRQKIIQATERILAASEAKMRFTEDKIRLQEDKLAVRFFEQDPDSEEAKELFRLKWQDYVMRYKRCLTL